MSYQQQPPPPPPPQGYPPQQGYQQGMPPQQGYQQGPYPQQPAPGYGAPQGYGQQQQPEPQGPPPTLADYYSQPTGGGGPSVKFPFMGFEFEFRVARDVSERDLEQQTNPQTKRLEFYNDGRRKIQLKIPLIVGVTADWPEGRATLYAKSGIREALDAAMAAAGCPPREFPKEGDTGWIKWVGTQPTGLSDKKLFEARYTPGPKWSNLGNAASNGQPDTGPPGIVTTDTQTANVAQVPIAPANTPAPPQQPAAQTPPPPPPPPGAAPQPAAPPPPAPAPQNAAQTPQRPEGMTDEQYAQFTGATTGQAPPPPPPPPGQAPPQ